MTERVTKGDLDILVKLIVKITGEPYHIEYMMGNPRLVISVGDKGGVRDVSPRLPKKEMHMWLHAFIDGMGACKCD